jgi:hypothetical protein
MSGSKSRLGSPFCLSAEKLWLTPCDLNPSLTETKLEKEGIFTGA